jgi:hypothetical protein
LGLRREIQRLERDKLKGKQGFSVSSEQVWISFLSGVQLDEVLKGHETTELNSS